MKTILRSQEFSCPSCVNKIEKALLAKSGVENAKVHFNTGRIEVDHTPDKISANELVEVIRSAGYEATVAPF